MPIGSEEMKRELEPFGRKKKTTNKNKNRDFFEDEYSPSKKTIQNQYRRKQKHRNLQDWDV